MCFFLRGFGPLHEILRLSEAQKSRRPQSGLVLQPNVAEGYVGSAIIIDGAATLTGLRAVITRHPGLPKRQPWALGQQPLCG